MSQKLKHPIFMRHSKLMVMYKHVDILEHVHAADVIWRQSFFPGLFLFKKPKRPQSTSLKRHQLKTPTTKIQTKTTTPKTPTPKPP